MSAGNLTTYESQLANFDGTTFSLVFARFGVPMTVLAAGALVLLWMVNAKITYFPGWIARWKLALFDRLWLTKALGIALAVLVAVAPLTMLLLWGIIGAVVTTPATPGLFVVFCGVAGMCIIYSLMYWRMNAWKLTIIPVVGMVSGVVVIWAFLIILLFMSPPFSYTGISFLFAAFNMVPMIAIAYISAPGLRVNFEQLIDDPARWTGDTLQLPADSVDEATATRRRRLTVAALYAGAVAILLAYALLVLFTTTSDRAVGFITAGVIVLLDGCVLLYHQAGLLTSPVLLALTLTGIRAAFVSWGSTYWFLGHCTVVLIVSVTLGVQIVQTLLPVVDTEAEARKQLGNPAKLLLELRERERRRSATPGVTHAAGPDDAAAAAAAAAAGGAAGSGSAVPAAGGAAAGPSATPGAAPAVDLEAVKARLTLIRWHLIIVSVLVLLFVVDIIVVGAVGPALITPVPLVTNVWPQYIFGCVVLVLVLVIPLLYLSYRFFRLNHYKPDRKMCVSAGVLELVSTGAGVFIYLLSGSWTQLWILVFLPIILFSACVALGQWVVHNDFDLLRPATERKRLPPAATVAAPAPAVPDAGAGAPGPGATPNVLVAFFRGLLPLDDYVMLGSIFVFVCAVIFLGLAIAQSAVPQPKWIGWTISLSFGLFAVTVVSLVRWFYTFSFDLFAIITGLVGIGILAGWCGAMLGTVFYVGTTPGMVVIFFTVMYVFAVFAGAALYQWKDDRWKLEPRTNPRSRFVVVGMAVCGTIIVAFDIALWVLSWIAGLAALIGILLIAYAVTLVYVWVQNKFYLPRPWKFSAAGVLLVVAGLGIGVGFVSGRPWYGFTASWGVLFIVCAVTAAREAARKWLEPSLIVQYAPYVFPVYRYDPCTERLVSSNYSVACAYAAFLQAGVWGILCAVFEYPTYAGIGVTSLVIVLTAIFTAQRLHEPLIDFGEAFQTLTPKLLQDALIRAFEREVKAASQLTATIRDVESQTVHATTAEESRSGLDKTRYLDALEAIEKIQAGQATLLGVLAWAVQAAGKPVEELRRLSTALHQPPARTKDLATLYAAADSDLAALNLDADLQRMLNEHRKSATHDLSARQLLSGLILADTLSAKLYEENTRFRVHFQVLAVQAARFQREREDALWRDMLLKMGINVDLDLIKNWSVAEHAAFRDKFAEYMKRVEAEEEELRRRREEDARAAAERERLLREEQERQLREAEEEAARRRAAEEAAERERRAAELAAQIEAERRRRQAEEEARLKAEHEEAERLRREEEERQRQRRAQEERERAERERLEAERRAAEEAERKRREEAAEAQRRAEEAERQRKMLAMQEELRRAEEARRESERKRLEAEREAERLRKEAEEAHRRAEAAAAAAAAEAERRRLAEEAERQRQKQEEMRRAEEEARRQAELQRQEAERIRKQMEEARKRAEAEAAEAERRRHEEEAERRRRAEEEARARAEAEARMRREREEAERRRREAAEAAERERQAKLAAERKRREEEERVRREREEAERRRLEEEARRAAAESAAAAAASAGSSTQPLKEVPKDVAQLMASIPPGGHFVDREFPAELKSLWRRKSKQAFPWKRAPELFGGRPYDVFQAGASPEDVEQGALGDCWLLSAMSVIAMNKGLLEPLFLAADKDKGIFVLQFFKNGRWRTVVVDDQFPAQGGRPAFAHSKSGNEMWMMLLEKAYAKLHGYYEAIEGGVVSAAFVDMTGGVSKDFELDSQDTKKEIFSGAFWAKLLEYKAKGYLLGAGSPAGSDTDISGMGIVQGHAYSILDLQEFDGHCLLRLRNPWGSTEWKGKWGDTWPGWTKRARAKLGEQGDSDDGAFWMELDDFAINFSNVYTCRIFTNMPCLSVDDQWKGVTAGGCSNFPTYKDNPQYALTVSRPSQVFILLRQADTRGTGKNLAHIGFAVLKKGGQRARTIYVGDTVVDSGSYTNAREVSAEATLNPGKYTVVPATFNPKTETSFSLLVYTDDPGASLTKID